MRLITLIVTTTIAASAADLPVRQVVIYKNGVGFFERGGELRAGESARLDFKAAEMNDVLKSLTVRDATGGTVNGVRYDSAEPLEKKLGEFPFKLGGAQPLSALLDQLKGAKIETNLGAGAIVGARAVKGAQGEDKEQLTILADDGAIRTFDLAGLTQMKLADAALQAQMREYMGAMTASRSKEKKSVYLDSANDKARNLSVSYMAPAAVWKSSYRLVFGASGDPQLEGWAIVDNTSGEDWTNIRLALVSGRPVSFLSRLYEPKYVEREYADLAEEEAVKPKVYQSGVAERLAGRAGLGGAMQVQVSAAPPTLNTEMSSAARVDTQAQEVGELFEYRFSSPVTVKRNESAMLPFLSQKITTRKLLIWTEGINPRNAAELTNATGKTLDGGPITVFDGGSYAGEALVETVKQGDKRLISYAVDLGTRVNNRVDSGEAIVTEIRAVRGVLTAKSVRRKTNTYNVDNIDAKAKTLIVEHPLDDNTKIIGTQPTETTTTARRFEVALKPKSQEKLAVVEEEALVEEERVSSLTYDQILVYTRNKAISAAGRQALEQILEKQRQMAQTQNEIAAAEKQSADLEKDQARARENIRSLSSVAGQQETVQRYAKQLSDQEASIAQLRDRANALRKQKDQQQTELGDMITKLSF
ncbi:MAG: hypothetical protein SFV18_09530 [Bryobacteraceae bacterium]|nr:hypothetical protein [Bryobacteraceae bacterium]